MTATFVMNREKSLNMLAKALTQKSWTITCAESCTGGGLAFAFTSVPGSSGWFDRSWVTYSNQAKQSCLGVDEDVLATYGAVSSETVIAMAKGAMHEAQADVAVAISGIAGPDGGSEEKPVGLVWFGFVFATHEEAVQQIFSGDRDSIRQQAVDFAIQKLVDGLVASS